MPPSFIPLVTSAVEEYNPDELAVDGVPVPDMYVTNINGADYVCKNKRDGCCKLQIYQVTSADSDCWTLKPVAKADD